MTDGNVYIRSNTKSENLILYRDARDRGTINSRLEGRDKKGVGQRDSCRFLDSGQTWVRPDSPLSANNLHSSAIFEAP
jgi:hypothetical protein